MVLILDMVTQNMLRTHVRHRVKKKDLICDCSISNQMPLTDHITEIAPISELQSNISNMA